MYVGNAIRPSRRFGGGSGRMLAITLDHAIARGVLPGIVYVETAISSVAAGAESDGSLAGERVE